MKFSFGLSLFIPVFTVMLFINISCSLLPGEEQQSGNTVPAKNTITLPEPDKTGGITVESAIYQRISRRNFTGEPLTLKELSLLLWASQGIGVDGVTGASRTAPSAGATHPVHIYVVAGNIEGLTAGVYRYDYKSHELRLVKEKDFRDELAKAALNQDFVSRAPASIVLAAEYARTTGRYGDRGEKYVHMEIGHISQNIYLQAESLDTGTVAVGAFNDDAVKNILETDHAPLMIMPVGKTG